MFKISLIKWLFNYNQKYLAIEAIREEIPPKMDEISKKKIKKIVLVTQKKSFWLWAGRHEFLKKFYFLKIILYYC